MKKLGIVVFTFFLFFSHIQIYAFNNYIDDKEIITLMDNIQNHEETNKTKQFFKKYGNANVKKYNKIYKNYDNILYSAVLEKNTPKKKPDNAFMRFIKTYISPDENQIFKDGKNMFYAWSGYDMMPSINSNNLNTKTNYGQTLFYSGSDIEVKRQSYSVATGWAVPTRFWGINGRFSFGLFTMIMQQNVANNNLIGIKNKDFRFDINGPDRYKNLMIKIGDTLTFLEEEWFTDRDYDWWGDFGVLIDNNFDNYHGMLSQQSCSDQPTIDNRDKFLKHELVNLDDIVFQKCYYRPYVFYYDGRPYNGWMTENFLTVRVKDIVSNIVTIDNNATQELMTQEYINADQYSYLNITGSLYTKTLGFEATQELIFGHQNLYLTFGFGVSYMFVVQQNAIFNNGLMNDYLKENMKKQLWNNSEFNWVVKSSLGHRFDFGLVLEATWKYYTNFGLYEYNRPFSYVGLMIGFVF